MADPNSAPEAEPYPAVLEAAASLGLNPGTLRYHLTKAGHLPQVQPDGRAYLTVTLAEAEEIVRSRRQASRARREKLAELPGLSAKRVAELLGIDVHTVYRLNQLRYLPADDDVMIDGRRVLRWAIPTVKAYAERRGRTLAE
jgi:predicted transcriptional regulator